MSSKRKKSRRNDSSRADIPLAAASEEINPIGAEADAKVSVSEDTPTDSSEPTAEVALNKSESNAPETQIEDAAESDTTAAQAADASESCSDSAEPVAACENEAPAEKDTDSVTDGAIPEVEKAPAEKKQLSTLEVILKWVQNIMLIICVSVFLVCLYLLGQNLYEKYRGNQIYSDADSMFNNVIPGEDNLLDINPQYMERPVAERTLSTMYDRLIGTSDESDDSVSATVLAQLELMRSSLSELIAANSEVCGWIYAPGTKINYPIARGSDNVYYLSHDYTKQYLAVGTPFVDCENDSDLSKNLNTVIYGHNVYNGSMFHDIEKFKSKDFFDSAKVYIYTMDGIYVYTPCSIYSTKDYYQYFRVQFSDDDDFISFTEEMISNSIVKSNISFEPGDQMLTLSTCTNNIEGDGRYALHLKMTEFITDKTEDGAETSAE